MNQYGDQPETAQVASQSAAKVVLIFFLCGLSQRWLVVGSVYLLPSLSHAAHVILWILLAIAFPVVAYLFAKGISLRAIAAFLAGLVLLTPILQLAIWHRLLTESYQYSIFYWPLTVSTITLFAIAENGRNA